MKLFAFDSPFSRFLTKVADLMILNILFLVFSIPLFTVGASATALYRCLLTIANGSGDRVVSMFLAAFRSNFKKATCLLLCSLPFVVLTALEVMFYLTGGVEKTILNCFFFVLPLFLVCCIVSFIFPLQAQFENTVRRTVKNAVIMAHMNFMPAVLITMTNLTIPAVAVFVPEIFLKFFPLWAIFGFSLPARLNTPVLRRVFSKYAPEVVRGPERGVTIEEND